MVAVAIDWALARLPAERRPLQRARCTRSVEIEAPIERTWAVLADIPGQTRWMPEMKSVADADAGPGRRGSIGEATIRIFGIAVTDRVAITTYDPPEAFGIEHAGCSAATGLLTLRPGLDGTTTTVDWVEHLAPPLLPRLGWLAPAAGDRATSTSATCSCSATSSRTRR